MNSFWQLLVIVLVGISLTEASTSTSPQFTANVTISSGGMLTNATMSYDWNQQKVKLSYLLPTGSPLTELFDYQQAKEYNVCSLSCYHTTLLDVMAQLWVNNSMTPMPYQECTNGILVDVYMFNQINTNYLITLWVSTLSNELVRASVLSSTAYENITFHSFIPSVSSSELTLPELCQATCSLKINLILALNYPGYVLDPLVTSIAVDATNRLFSTVSATSAAVIYFDTVAHQVSTFTTNLTSIIQTIQNPGATIRTNGDEFLLSEKMFNALNPPNDEINIVFFVGTSTATYTSNQLVKLKSDGVVVFAATTDPNYDIVPVASFPSYAFIIPDTSAINAAMNQMTDTLCTSAPPPCSCANDGTCACGLCICPFPWGNDFSQGIYNCTVCTRTSEDFCGENGIINPDCKTCTYLSPTPSCIPTSTKSLTPTMSATPTQTPTRTPTPSLISTITSITSTGPATPSVTRTPSLSYCVEPTRPVFHTTSVRIRPTPSTSRSVTATASRPVHSLPSKSPSPKPSLTHTPTPKRKIGGGSDLAMKLGVGLSVGIVCGAVLLFASTYALYVFLIQAKPLTPITPAIPTFVETVTPPAHPTEIPHPSPQGNETNDYLRRGNPLFEVPDAFN